MRLIVLSAVVLFSAATFAQQPAPPAQAPARGGGPGNFPFPRASAPPDAPREFSTIHERIRVVPLVKGLASPWSIAFLPTGEMLVTEKPGRLRIVRNGVLDPEPIAGTPQVNTRGFGAGLLEVSLHPRFAENRFVYLTYSKPGPQGGANGDTTALARGRFDGKALTDVQDIFVADAWTMNSANQGGRLTWGRDGTLFMTVGDRNERRSQDTTHHAGMVLRLRDDGTVPPDNPFVGRAGFRPEIYSYGHRSQQGLATHPDTGEIWETEHGPFGGDELNVIRAGKNYGWPLVSFGREYDGRLITTQPVREGIESPETVWLPSIAPSGMVFYTGDKLPKWKGSLFVGALSGLQLHRIVFQEGRVWGREVLLSDLRLRLRDVRQGPDGFLYIATDATPNGVILRIEQAPEPPATTQR